MPIITTAHVKQYSASIVHLAQQKFSRLRNTVLNEPLVGEEGFFEQLGPTELAAVTSRHGDTVYTDPDHQRRQVISNPFAVARLVDSFDKARVLIEPAGNYAMSQAMGVARKIDQTIIDAFDATAKTGKSGGDSTSPNAANEIADGNVGLTIGKLTSAMKLLLDGGVDPNVEELHIAISAQQLKNLLDSTTVTSIDFNTVKALMSGTINAFMGFEFHIFGGTAARNATLAIDSSDIRSCFAYAKTGMVLATAEEAVTTIDRMPNKNNSVQILTKMDLGSTRLEETKVIHILCDETPD